MTRPILRMTTPEPGFDMVIVGIVITGTGVYVGASLLIVAGAGLTAFGLWDSRRKR